MNAKSSHWSGFDFDCETNWNFWAFHNENFSAKSSKAPTPCDLGRHMFLLRSHVDSNAVEERKHCRTRAPPPPPFHTRVLRKRTNEAALGGRESRLVSSYALHTATVAVAHAARSSM